MPAKDDWVQCSGCGKVQIGEGSQNRYASDRMSAALANRAVGSLHDFTATGGDVCAVCGTTDCPNPYDEVPEPEPATASEPIPAFRKVKVVEHGSDLFLTGKWGRVYGVEADAKCTAGLRMPGSARHDAPAHGCRCGFYAWPDPNRFASDTPVAEVELSGRILEGPQGWRAEHVTTKKVTFPNFCFRCAGPATRLAVDRTNREVGKCPSLVPVCGGHPVLGREYSLAEVSERLGCTVEMREAPKKRGPNRPLGVLLWALGSLGIGCGAVWSVVTVVSWLL